MQKPSLYLIGHSPDALFLERLLSQVKPHIDGIAFVNTDDTDTCRNILEKSGIKYFYETQTFAERSQFDFSLCRNRALNLARKHFDGWLMWLDLDDTITGLDRLTGLMQQHQHAAYALPYDVADTCDNVIKVRIHRGDKWKWIGRVHEELICEGEKPDVAVLRDVVVKHEPKDKSNHDFHIELLKAEGDHPNNQAYIAKEYFNTFRYAEAIEWAEKAIAHHPYETEQYNCLLIAGVSYHRTGNNEAAEHCFKQALHILPHRREAYFYLSMLCSLDEKKQAQALGYAAACNAQIDTHEAGQNAVIYNSAGYLVHAELLLNSGRPNQAHNVICRAKWIDDEVRKLTLKIEEAMKQNAIARRAA